MPSPVRLCPVPSGTTRTWHQLMVLPLDCGSLTRLSTWPTTIGPVSSSVGRWTSSSSSPTFTSSAMTSSAVASAGTAAYSRSHDSGILT
jgi:hypothetical protein